MFFKETIYTMTMTTAEKRSFTLSMKKAKVSFLSLGQKFSGTIDLYDSFYAHLIELSSKAAWLKGRELDEAFKVESLPKIEALLADEIDNLISKAPCVPTRKQLKRRAKNKLGRNDVCSCGSNKKYKKCCLVQIV